MNPCIRQALTGLHQLNRRSLSGSVAPLAARKLAVGSDFSRGEMPLYRG